MVGVNNKRFAFNPKLLSEDKEKLENLFRELDINGDGKLDAKDLNEAFKRMGVHQGAGHAQRFLEKTGSVKLGAVDFSTFAYYVREHELKLLSIFNKLDINKDGKIDSHEIIKSFKTENIKIDKSEADRLMKSMDKDKSFAVDFDEWRDYLLWHPSADLKEILTYWRHATVIDIGEDTLVPDDFTETEMITGMWWRHLVAGGLAGAVSRTCTAPLDRLKVFLQVHGSKHSSLGISKCFKNMLEEGGMKSLWRGNGINVLKIAPESALKFMAYEQAKRIIIGGTRREPTIYERFAAGSLAGGISQTIIYPMEVLKTRLALRKTGQYRGIWDCARKILQHEGISSFYRGYVPNLLGIIPYAGIDLAIYETLKKVYLSRHENKEDPGVLVLLACGTASSTCGQLASYPLALVRTRLQAQGSSKKDNMISQFRSILQNEGIVGLYRGIAPNFLKVAPAVSISYVVYEHTRRALGVAMT